jgi:hypothetical protein
MRRYNLRQGLTRPTTPCATGFFTLPVDTADGWRAVLVRAEFEAATRCGCAIYWGGLMMVTESGPAGRGAPWRWSPSYSLYLSDTARSRSRDASKCRCMCANACSPSRASIEAITRSCSCSASSAMPTRK